MCYTKVHENIASFLENHPGDILIQLFSHSAQRIVASSLTANRVITFKCNLPIQFDHRFQQKILIGTKQSRELKDDNEIAVC